MSLDAAEGDLKQANLFVRYDGEYMRPDSVEEASKYKLYHFKKLIFKNVPVDEDGFEAGEYVIVMVPTGMDLPTPDADVLVRNSAYGMIYDSQEIHFASQPTDKYKLSRKNLTALGE